MSSGMMMDFSPRMLAELFSNAAATWPTCCLKVRESLKPSPAGTKSNLSDGIASTRAKRPLRSEERRVGKECRSLCDWSSDVCFPILADLLLESARVLEAIARRDEVEFVGRHRLDQGQEAAQIGRASCRERV